MPLEFESLSHGRIAFGFFNIETDMILLNHYFLFADDFCHHISQATETRDGVYESPWDVYRVEPQNIGTLMGAIRGFDHRGFIGEVYKRYPFPTRPEEFKQKPEGCRNRPSIEALILPYGKRTTIPFRMDPKNEKISIGEYHFSRISFQELIRYVWIGGFPRWQDGIRPASVLAMKEAVDRSGHPLFEGMMFHG